MVKGLTVAFVAALLLGGCCDCRKEQRLIEDVPAPISVEEQVDRLNLRARALPRMSMSGTVVIRTIEKGKQEQRTAEGQLLFQQRYGEEGLKDSGDVFLSGRAFGQEVFRAAKNQEKWWFIVRHETNTAWVGDVSESDKTSAGGNVMRVDAVLDVLGVTEILPRPGELITMRVNDLDQRNELLIIKINPNGTGWIKREITIDRVTGDVTQVQLYNAKGALLIRAELDKYREITYREGNEIPKGFKPQRFPFDIWITYVAQKASIHFTIEPGKAEVRERLPKAPFEEPDYQEEGLKVERVGG
jgi:hypothetical protein